MRQILIFAAVALVVGGYAARFADRTMALRTTTSASAVQPAAKPRPASAAPQTLVVPSDRHGHFQVDASVDGRHIGFVIDTGASLVILRESDAAKVGIRPTPRDYTATVSTANGTIRAAHARLNRVEVGDIAVYDVAALVLPDQALGQNLLGVSFLSRLRRYEYANGRMVLEQ